MDAGKITDSEIISEIKEIIKVEIEGLNALLDSVDGAYVEVVRMIHECSGKVVMIGIGKSGIVARKIAATFASTGTPAIFVHPVEGMHGDLGIITKGDIVVAVSKSGESAEINVILPVVRRMGAGIIALTGNKASTMVKLADRFICFGELQEACPFNTAPTTSTTATLVIGDAIALALMKLDNFKLDDFALFHPGGRIGKRLIVRVSDIMLCGQNNPSVNLNASVRDMIIRITEKQAGAVSVVDKDGKLAGLITDYDIRRILEKGGDIFSMNIKEVMNPSPVSIDKDEMAYAALKTMQGGKKNYIVMPVVDGANVAVGMLRLLDIVKAGL
jgi:arabinose-5-phosphate isomerase